MIIIGEQFKDILNMTDITKILKFFPVGTVLYSPICGDCMLTSVNDEVIEVTTCDKELTFDKYGRFQYDQGECLLFLARNKRSWKYIKAPVCQFNPFDKVIVRSYDLPWTIDFFSYYDESGDSDGHHYVCLGGYNTQCLPCNDVTIKLVGTNLNYKL